MAALVTLPCQSRRGGSYASVTRKLVVAIAEPDTRRPEMVFDNTIWEVTFYDGWWDAERETGRGREG